MQNIDKRVIVFLVVIVGIFAGVWFYLQEAPVAPVTNNPSPAPTATPQKPPSLYSLNGTVKSINQSTYILTLADGKTQQSFNVPPTVTVVKRVTTKTNTTFATDKLSSVKVGTQLVFYSTSDPAQGTPEVTKIEIIK